MSLEDGWRENARLPTQWGIADNYVICPDGKLHKFNNSATPAQQFCKETLNIRYGRIRIGIGAVPGWRKGTDAKFIPDREWGQWEELKDANPKWYECSRTMSEIRNIAQEYYIALQNWETRYSNVADPLFPPPDFAPDLTEVSKPVPDPLPLPY